MEDTTPVQVGTRATVGSPIMQEIEYFRKLESNCNETPEKAQTQMGTVATTSNKSQSQMPTIAPSSNSSRTRFGLVVVTSKKKKKGGGGGFLPNMCSFVEVAETNRPAGFPGFNYRNLKTDAKKLQG